MYLNLTKKSTIFALLILLWTLPTLAQKSNESTEIKTIRNEIQRLYRKLKVSDYQNIIPYTVNGNIGFVNAATKKNILEPTPNLKDVTLAKPNIILRA